MIQDISRYRLLLGAVAFSSSILLYGCSKKEAAPVTPAVQAVNIPQFLTDLQNLPSDQRKAYVKQHPAEEQAVLASGDPQQTQQMMLALGQH
jgi:hypothetical protein